MPELPEVETLKRELDRHLAGQTIKAVQVLWPKAVKPLSAQAFSAQLSGVRITGLDRRAKMLILNLSKDNHLVFHLKMTGQLIFVPKKGLLISGGHPTADIQTPGRHTRIIFTFRNGDHLYFNDLRKFGWTRLVDGKDLKDLTKNTGPEPLAKGFTEKHLREIFKRYQNRTVKQILLDQSLIAGIGNIYADESAFLSGVRPMRRAKDLSDKEISNLHKNIIAVLKLSIRYKGTSSRNYRRSDGSLGGFVPHLMVYGRHNETCKKCGRKILKIKHAGRGTHYCPICQK